MGKGNGRGKWKRNCNEQKVKKNEENNEKMAKENQYSNNPLVKRY